MLVNEDFTRPAFVSARQYQWVASPQSGVERVMLDRLGGEKARATSIVRYAPNSFFPRHLHPGGEEILVLSGSFSEGDKRYPAGWYLRNPPGSSHQPSSEDGATLFVKLCQMLPGQAREVRINTRDPKSWTHRNGREICPLFLNETERVELHRLKPGETVFDDAVEGAELLVLAGDLLAGEEVCECGSWMRWPSGSYPQIRAGLHGATIYLKTGHLARTAWEA